MLHCSPWRPSPGVYLRAIPPVFFTCLLPASASASRLYLLAVCMCILYHWHPTIPPLYLYRDRVFLSSHSPFCSRSAINLPLPLYSVSLTTSKMRDDGDGDFIPRNTPP